MPPPTPRVKACQYGICLWHARSATLYEQLSMKCSAKISMFSCLSSLNSAVLLNHRTNMIMTWHRCTPQHRPLAQIQADDMPSVPWFSVPAAERSAQSRCPSFGASNKAKGAQGYSSTALAASSGRRLKNPAQPLSHYDASTQTAGLLPS